MAADASAEASAAALLDDESDEEADTQLEQEGGGDGQEAVEAGDVVVEGAGEGAEAAVVVEQAVVPAAADDAPTDGAAEPAPAGEGISATSPYVGVVRLHGLLAGTTNKDIVEFLAVEGGVSLVSESDVVFQLEQRGAALVGLRSAGDIEAALKRHKEHMGSRWIAVEKAELIDAFKDTDASQDSMSAVAFSLLPGNATAAALADWLAPHALSSAVQTPIVLPSALRAPRKKRRRLPGTAIALMTGPDVASAAVAALHNTKFGDKETSLRVASAREFAHVASVAHEAGAAAEEPDKTKGQADAPAAAAEPATEPADPNPKRFTCVHVRGVPFSFSRLDIVDWLRGKDAQGVADGGRAVVLAKNRKGKSRGDCYIRLVSADAATALLALSGAKMGTRPVKLHPVSIGEAEREVGMPREDLGPGGDAPPSRAPAPAPGPPPPALAGAADIPVSDVPKAYGGLVMVGGIGRRCSPEDLIAAAAAAGWEAFLNDVFVLGTQNMANSGEAIIRLRNCSMEQASAVAAKVQTAGVGGVAVQARQVFQGDLDEALDRAVVVGRTRSPARALRLRGLPWEATETDVLSLFAAGEGLAAPSRVHFIPDDRQPSRASGSALVLFLDEARAKAAMARNGAKVAGRFVELFRFCEGDFEALVAPAGQPPPTAALPGGRDFGSGGRGDGGRGGDGGWGRGPRGPSRYGPEGGRRGGRPRR